MKCILVVRPSCGAVGFSLAVTGLGFMADYGVLFVGFSVALPPSPGSITGALLQIGWIRLRLGRVASITESADVRAANGSRFAACFSELSLLL